MIHVFLAQFSGQIKQNLCGSTTQQQQQQNTNTPLALALCAQKTATHAQTIEALNTELGLMIPN